MRITYSPTEVTMVRYLQTFHLLPGRSITYLDIFVFVLAFLSFSDVRLVNLLREKTDHKKLYQTPTQRQTEFIDIDPSLRIPWRKIY
jgi:hypothetical protein